MTLESLSSLEVVVHTPQEHNHSSYVLAGLFELEHRRLLKRLAFHFSIDKNKGAVVVNENGTIVRTGESAKKVTFLTLKDHSCNRMLHVAIDLRDHATIFSLKALEECDVVFKRSYVLRYIQCLSEWNTSKIHPAGLSFGVRSPNEHHQAVMFASLITTHLRHAISASRRPQHILKELQHIYAHWRFTRNSRLIGQFRESLVRRTMPRILFQTRTFNRTDDTDANEVHEQRAQFIRMLRKEFGKSFAGGFVPDELVNRLYPDCISDLPTDRLGYLREVQSSAIAVYTRGLVNSVPWKLSEYLASGKAIVGERLQTELPDPLAEGVHLSSFTDVEECIRTCGNLLKNPEQVDVLSKNARAYYDAHVEPTVALHRILRKCLTYI